MDFRGENLVEFCLELVDQTTEALCVRSYAGKVWLSLDEVRWVRNGDGTVQIALPEWLADRNRMLWRSIFTLQVDEPPRAAERAR
jgi:hypothetical protein